MRELPCESWGRFSPSLPAVFPHSLFSLVFSDREPGLGYAPPTVAMFRVRDIPAAGSDDRQPTAFADQDWKVLSATFSLAVGSFANNYYLSLSTSGWHILVIL